jgi:hypothetical protein
MRLLLPTVAAAIAAVMPLQADTVFTDFQSGTSPVCAVVGGPLGSIMAACAAAFTPSANYIMTDAQVKVKQNGAPSGNFDLFLYSNSGGLPGSSLGTIGSGTAPTTGLFGIVTVNSPALSLVSGTEYWLVVAPHDQFTLLSWADGGSPVPPTAKDGHWPSSNWSATSQSSQFQIDGTLAASTPEPVTLGVVAAGLLFVALRKGRSAMSIPSARGE